MGQIQIYWHSYIALGTILMHLWNYIDSNNYNTLIPYTPYLTLPDAELDKLAFPGRVNKWVSCGSHMVECYLKWPK